MAYNPRAIESSILRIDIPFLELDGSIFPGRTTRVGNGSVWDDGRAGSMGGSRGRLRMRRPTGLELLMSEEWARKLTWEGDNLSLTMIGKTDPTM